MVDKRVKTIGDVWKKKEQRDHAKLMITEELLFIDPV